MDNTGCSDEYLDGLQAAYRAVAKIGSNLAGDRPTASKIAINAALIAIDREIEKAVREQPSKIILP